MRSIMRSSWIKGSMVLMAVLAIGASGCRTTGTAGRSAGEAVGDTAEAAGDAAGTAARGVGDVIGDTAEEADRELD